MNGWAIAKRIGQVANEVLHVQQGSLYPALHRLEQQAWIKAQWSESQNNRKAKYYSLTQLAANSSRQSSRIGSVSQVLSGSSSRRCRVLHALDDLLPSAVQLFRTANYLRPYAKS